MIRSLDFLPFRHFLTPDVFVDYSDGGMPSSLSFDKATETGLSTTNHCTASAGYLTSLSLTLLICQIIKHLPYPFPRAVYV